MNHDFACTAEEEEEGQGPPETGTEGEELLPEDCEPEPALEVFSETVELVASLPPKPKSSKLRSVVGSPAPPEPPASCPEPVCPAPPAPPPVLELADSDPPA